MAIANITNNILTDSGVATSSLLPLAGGTLTGALSGTSATFSSSVTATGAKSQFIANGGNSAGAGISLNTTLTSNPTLRRNWGIFTEDQVEGDFAIKCSTAAGLDANLGNSRLSITSNGNVLVGTTSENAYGGSARSIQIDGSGSLLETRYSGTSALRVGSGSDHSFHHEPRNVQQRFATNDSTRFYIYGNGNYEFTGSNVSDRRAKENITTIDLNATNKIMQLEAKSYNMKNNPSQKRYGFIAQDVKEVVADLISGNDTDGYLGLDYDGLLALAIKAIQEQQIEIQNLKQKVYEN